MGNPYDDQRGVRFIEWVVVTLIMIVATFAILQAVGDQLQAAAQTVITFVRNLLGI